MNSISRYCKSGVCLVRIYVGDAVAFAEASRQTQQVVRLSKLLDSASALVQALDHSEETSLGSFIPQGYNVPEWGHRFFPALAP